MDCLPIDWKCIDGSFEKDDFYETIQAPKWIDFSAPLQPVDDHAWFCGRVGCAHERRSALQAVYQERKPSIKANKEPVLLVAPVAIPNAGVGVSNSERPRRVVSSSLSSLSALRATYAKDKVAYHTQLPSIGECKGGPAKSARQPQASENENPNRARKVEVAAFKKSALFRGAESKEKKTKISTASSSALPEQVSLSQTGCMLEASKSTFIFGERNPTHAKSTTVTRIFRKDATSVSASISGAKILKVGGTRTVSRLQPTARNSHLTASLVMPLRKSTTNARHLNGGVFVGTATFKPVRLTKDVKVAVKAQTCEKRSDYKEEGTSKKMYTLKDKKHNIYTGLPLNLQESKNNKHSPTQRELKEGEPFCGVDSLIPPMLQEQEGHSPVVKDESLCHAKISNSLEGGADEGVSSDIQTREKEDSIQNTLEKFLENLRLTSHEEEAILNVEKCTSEQRLGHHKDHATTLEPCSKQAVVNESDPFDCTTLKSHRNDNVHPLKKEIVGEHDEDSASEQEMVQSMRCSSHSEAVSSLNGIETIALQMTSNVVLDDTSEQRASSNNHEANTIINQKQDFKVIKDWQRHQGTKRKSSELNSRINHDIRDHKHETQMVPLLSQQSKQSISTAKLHVMAYGSKDSYEDHHKMMKTTVAPFRLRSEERGALKGLGLAKKEPRVQLPREAVHHALRMPSFGHPFKPERSKKKLTIPKEPKFHLSKTRKAVLLFN